MALFSSIQQAPQDPVFGFHERFLLDPRKDKVDLSVGVYRDADLETRLLPSVDQARRELLNRPIRASYLPIEGDPLFLDSYGALVFGEALWSEHKERIAVLQTVGGTSALHIGGELLLQEVGESIYLPSPTWPNHRQIFSKLGMRVQEFGYYSFHSRSVAFDSIIDGLKKAPTGSIFLFHATCHNPTGSDLSYEQWEEVAIVAKKRELLIFFDLAYQGFGNGIEEDRSAVSLFLKSNTPFLVAASCSKNFSLYCQRLGVLMVVAENKEIKRKIQSQIQLLARVNYSNPPAFGSSVVGHILSSKELTSLWKEDLSQIRARLENLRMALVTGLKKGGVDSDFLSTQRGMFAYLNLSPSEVSYLIKEKGIYILEGGRINLSGLTKETFPRLIDAISNM